MINPFAFRPGQVTLWTTAAYLALLIPVIYVLETVPQAPAESALPAGVSIDEAWADLANVTQKFHPANSHANDDVRTFILGRISSILDESGLSWTTQADRVDHPSLLPVTTDYDAVVFDDMLTNVTFTSNISDSKRSLISFQGTNVYVYLRGSNDPPGSWWQQPQPEDGPTPQLVLVNAHFDSVPSSYGATDDGVGVVSALQVLRRFAYTLSSVHRPRNGLVVLLNNAEEEFLLGACAFGNSPLAPAIRTFVNLEGAGAGGRTVLFRSTDLDVMRAYRRSPHPFGSVVSNDVFKLGVIRSETDYRVWVDMYGYRGLDLAFFRPRDRYHTPTDDRRHTSRNSLWHMLSAALASTEGLLAGAPNPASASTVPVWFDLFGDSLVLFALQGLFAWALTLLIVGPLLLGALFYLLYRSDKDYLFRAYANIPASADDEASAEKIPIGGWKGFFRFPVALSASSAVLVGTSLLLRKVQPFVVHNSLYTVIALIASVFYIVFWAIMRSVSLVRPSALQRTYAHLWQYLISWVLLLLTAVVADQKHISSGYFITFWATDVLLASVVSLLELLLLPRKTDYAQDLVATTASVPATTTFALDDDADGENDVLISPSPGEAPNESLAVRAAEEDVEDEQDGQDPVIPTEISPLIGGHVRNGRPTTFSTGYHRAAVAIHSSNDAAHISHLGSPFGREQAWSVRLPSWTWLLQFLLLAASIIIMAGQLGIFLGTSIHQTGTDGSSLLAPYLLISIFTVLCLLPLTPFIHRVSYHLPLVLLAVAAGSLLYCLTSFPFSAANPYKVFLRQTFSVDTGNTSILITGHEAYISRIKADIPFARDRPWSCVAAAGRQEGLVNCAIDGSGMEPRLNGTDTPFADNYAKLVAVRGAWVSPASPRTHATLYINAVNSKTCTLRFVRPVRHVSVRGGLPIDKRFKWTAPQKSKGEEDGDAGDGGVDGNEQEIGDITLWRRDWGTPWVVDVDVADEDADKALLGSVACRWSDANTPGTVPALDQALQYAPTWSIVSVRANPPLVEGTKDFAVL